MNFLIGLFLVFSGSIASAQLKSFECHHSGLGNSSISGQFSHGDNSGIDITGVMIDHGNEFEIPYPIFLQNFSYKRNSLSHRNWTLEMEGIYFWPMGTQEAQMTVHFDLETKKAKGHMTIGDLKGVQISDCNMENF